VTRCEKTCLIRGDAGRMRFAELRQHVPDIRRSQSAYDAREPGPARRDLRPQAGEISVPRQRSAASVHVYDGAYRPAPADAADPSSTPPRALRRLGRAGREPHPVL